MKGTPGRDCSPKRSQRSLMGEQTARAPQGVKYSGLGTPLGGAPPEASGGAGGAASGVLDPAMFNVDGHAVRVFSRYLEGKRTGPDWLHTRIEQAERQRLDAGLELARKS